MGAFENKLVAVMNEKIEPGVIMNALAHLCIGFGSEIGKEALRLTNYVDGDGGSHPSISEMPFIKSPKPGPLGPGYSLPNLGGVRNPSQSIPRPLGRGS